MKENTMNNKCHQEHDTTELLKRYRIEDSETESCDDAMNRLVYALSVMECRLSVCADVVKNVASTTTTKLEDATLLLGVGDILTATVGDVSEASELADTLDCYATEGFGENDMPAACTINSDSIEMNL